MTEGFVKKQLDEADRLIQSADARYLRGELPQGIDHDSAAISLLEDLKVRCPVQWWGFTEEFKLASAYARRGEARFQANELSRAIGDCEAAICLLEDLKVRCPVEWGFAEEFRLASVYVRRGAACCLDGEVPHAIGDCDAAISVLEDAKKSHSGQWGPDEQIALAHLHTMRGEFWRWEDELSRALDDLRATVSLLKDLRTSYPDQRYQWEFQARSRLAFAYTSRGYIHGKRGEGGPFQAIKDYDDGISVWEDLRTSHLGQWGFAEQFDLATDYGERGEVHFRMDAVDQAVKDYGTAVHILRELKAAHHPADWGPLEQMELALACIRNSEAHQRKGDLEQARSDWDSANSIYEEIESDSDWQANPITKEGLFDVHVRMLDLLLKLDHRSIYRWAWTKGQRMTRELELAPPSDAHRHSSELRRLFSVFHSKWLKYSAEHDLERIPLILSAIQGRKLTAQIIEELDQDPIPPPEVERYRNLRRKLIEESERIARSRRVHGGKTDPGLFGYRRLNTNPATVAGGIGIRDLSRDLLNEYKADLAKLPDLRRAAAQHEGYAALLQPFEPVTVEDLRAKVAGDEALVLLIDYIVDGERGQGAYVVRQGRAPKWIQVDGLGQGQYMPKDQNDQDDASVPRTHEAEFWRKASNGLRQRLWEPLGTDLQDVKKAVVVTHGSLHLLPLEAGKPEDLELTRYPGLIYFNQRRRQTKWPENRLLLGLCSYPGDDDQTQIPLTGAECRMIADLHRQVRDAPNIEYPLNFDAPRSIDFVFLSCHGRSDLANPASTSLAIGPGQSLDAHRIHAGGVHAYYVFASACLGGVTIEDDDGDPMGLYSGFWLHGTRVMVAALVPVPDEWMPLLSLLTIQAVLRGRHALEVALREAKRRLASGEWYEDSAANARDSTETLLRKHVIPTMKMCYIRPTLEAYRKGPRMMWAERIKRLCEAYAVDPDVSRELSDRFVNNAARPDMADEVIDEIVDACAEARLASRVPPCPVLATLLYGVCAFGETD